MNNSASKNLRPTTRTKRVELAFTPREHLIAVQVATANGLTLAAYGRAAVLSNGAKIRSKAPIIDPTLAQALSDMARLWISLDENRDILTELLNEFKGRTQPDAFVRLATVFNSNQNLMSELNQRVAEIRLLLIKKAE